MKLKRSGLININQRGFTLIELLVVIAITAVISGGISTSIIQIINGNTRSSNDMTAVRQVHESGYWVSYDSQMAQSLSVNASAANGFPLTLTWTDWEGIDYVSIYNINAGRFERQRIEYNAGGTEIENTTSVIARFIDSSSSACELFYNFKLPDIGDEFKIVYATQAASGHIVITQGSVTITPSGSATVAGSGSPLSIDSTSGAVAWEIFNSGDTISITADSTDTFGTWTTTYSNIMVSTITDADYDTAIDDRPVLMFTITAVVGTDPLTAIESRVYEVIPKPTL